MRWDYLVISMLWIFPADVLCAVAEWHWNEGAVGTQAPLEDEFLIEWYGTLDGLPTTQVSDLAQTRDGYLWFAALDGLARYDGMFMETFRPKPLGQSGPGVPTALWVGSDSYDLFVSHFGGLSRIAGLDVRTSLLAESQQAFRALRLWPGPDETLFLSWRHSILSFQNEKFVEISFEERDWGEVLSVERLQGGDFLVGGTKGLWRWSGKAIEIPDEVRTVAGGKLKRVDQMLELKDGTVWVSCPWGLMSLRDGQLSPKLRYRRNDRAVSTAFLFQANKGEIWLGVSGLGVRRFNPDAAGIGRELNYFHGLDLGVAREDFEESIWLVARKFGVGRLWRRPVMAVRPKYRSEDSLCHAIYAAQDGNVWVGTNRGVYQLRNGAVSHVDHPLIEDGLRVRCFAEDQQGQLWFTQASGIGVLRSDSYHQPREDVCPLPETIEPVCLVARKNGEMWLGCKDGLYRFDPAEARIGEDNPYEPWLCLPELQRVDLGMERDSVAVQLLFEDRDSRLWVGTSGDGVYHESAAGWVHLDESDGLRDLSISDFCLDGDGRLWVGTSRGLHLWRDGFFDAVTFGDGLHNDVINALTIDLSGDLWVGTNQGVLRFSADDLAEAVVNRRVLEIPQIVYTRADGMPVSEISGAHGQSSERLPDGRLCFATESGLALIDPSDVGPVAAPPPITIRKVELDQVVVKEWLTFNPEKTPELVIPPGQGQLIEIYFAANTYLGTGRMAYRYRLLGLDQEWVHVDEGRSAVFTGLSPGRYQFQVIAANRHGVWNHEGASIDLWVQPMFYQTGWFVVLVLLGLFVASYGWHRNRLAIQRERSTLEMAIGVERERARIAGEMHDDLGNQLARITFLSSEENGRGRDERMAKITSIARDSIGSMNEIVWAISAEGGTIRGLFEYIQDYGLRLAEDAGLQLCMELAHEGVDRSLAFSVRRNVFLVFKEAINNAIKHSGSAVVSLELRWNGEMIFGSVADEGIGLSRGFHHPARHGLANMRKRVKSLQGEMRMDSAPGQGVTLSFRFRLSGELLAQL